MQLKIQMLQRSCVNLWSLPIPKMKALSKQRFCMLILLLYETMCRVEPGFTPYTIRDASGAAMGLVWYWAMDGFAYLEHFAVAKTHRNAGVGAQILAEFLKFYPNVVLEVEEPVDDITRRRVAFYCRNGMTFNDFSYTNPGYWKTPMYHTLCLVSSQPMDSARCQKFVEDFIYPKPLSYVG